MSVEQPKPSAASHSLSCVSIALRVGGGLLILSCLLASLVNPYPAHPKAAVTSKQQQHTSHTKVRRDIVRYSENSTRAFDAIDLVLPQFPTLQAGLDSSEVVVVFFGASWNKNSASVANQMGQILGPKLKEATKHKHDGEIRKPLSVIYVSSDSHKHQFQKYVQNRYWSSVPFHSKEAKKLKKYYKVCARKELETLQIMERKHELPYMLIFSGESHKVVSRTGVTDLKKLGLGVLDHWTKLARGKKATAT